MFQGLGGRGDQDILGYGGKREPVRVLGSSDAVKMSGGL